MAIKIANNSKELYRLLNDSLYSNLDSIATKVKTLWYKYLQERYYDAYDPIMYERQYAILEALVRTDVLRIGKKYRVDVYIDQSIMNKYHPTSDPFNGRRITEIIEKTGMVLDNGVVREPSFAYEETVKWLSKNWEQFLRENI